MPLLERKFAILSSCQLLNLFALCYQHICILEARFSFSQIVFKTVFTEISQGDTPPLDLLMASFSSIFRLNSISLSYLCLNAFVSHFCRFDNLFTVNSVAFQELRIFS